MRVLVAGIVGGIVMFMWGFVSHTMLPLGDMGVKEFPNEEIVLAALKQNLSEPGLYFFPGMGHGDDISQEQMAAWEEKYKTGPIGVMSYRPAGRAPMSMTQLGTELGFNVLAVLLGAFIVAHVTGGYGMRLLCFILIGVTAWASLSTSYWNWYGFPTEYTTAELITEGAAWLLVGLVAAAIVKPSTAPATMA
jgi:hypothetical protein